MYNINLSPGEHFKSLFVTRDDCIKLNKQECGHEINDSKHRTTKDEKVYNDGICFVSEQSSTKFFQNP